MTTAYAPPTHPTFAEQCDALVKGLGRAMQWARERTLDEEPLRSACLECLVYDLQCEDHRDQWLWNLITAAGLRDRLRPAMLASLDDLRPGYDATPQQRCGLAMRYAQAGDEAFRDRLYEIVRTVPLDADAIDGGDRTLGVEEVVRLDGLDGMVAISDSLVERTDDDDLACLLRHLASLLFADDESADGRLLTALQEAGGDAQRLADRWEAANREETPKPPAPPITDDRPLAERAIAEAHGEPGSRLSHAEWRDDATPADARLILDAAFATDDLPIVRKLLMRYRWVRERPFDRRLLTLADLPDRFTQARAWSVLREVRHPKIRAIAERGLQAPESDRHWLDALHANFLPGDEPRIEAAMTRWQPSVPPGDGGDRHGLLFGVLSVLERNEHADVDALATRAYFETPCTNCRRRAAVLLRDRGTPPDWLVAETAEDCDESVRRVFTGDTGD